MVFSRKRTRKQSKPDTAITSKAKGTLKNRLKKISPLIGGAAGAAALALIAGKFGSGPVLAAAELHRGIP